MEALARARTPLIGYIQSSEAALSTQPWVQIARYGLVVDLAFVASFTNDSGGIGRGELAGVVRKWLSAAAIVEGWRE